jgi:hypothetical protein
MEALATASSIAGLLSLAGNCISGAQNLRSLYQDIATASQTVQSFFKDLNSLIRTLEDVRNFLEKIQSLAPTLVLDDVSLTTLKLQLEDCDSDVFSWLRAAQSTKTVDGKGTRGWFRKFWKAMDKQSIESYRRDMQRRRTEIAVALSLVGR